MAQFLLASTNKTMERSISVIGWTFEQGERFSELGELGELFESLNVDIDGDGIMELLISDLFRGVFDPENPDAKPTRYARASYEQSQTMAVPSWTFMNRVKLMAGNCLNRLDHRYGSSSDVVALMFLSKSLPIDTPEELGPEFITAAKKRLTEIPKKIQRYSEEYT